MSASPHAGTSPVDPAPEAAPLSIGGVTLAARDAGALAAFYAGLLGVPAEPDPARPGAFRLGFGPATLRLLPSPSARPERGDEPGLFHTAFLLPGRAALAGWLRHARAQGVTLQGASDHGVSDAFYLTDPEGNGIEVYADRPRALWPRPLAPAEGVAMVTRRLDIETLLAEAPAPALEPARTRIGHVHLRVGDVAATEGFYRGLGLAVMQHMPRASFLSSGGYHHHLALNNWGSAGRRPEGLSGLLSFTLRAADEASFRQAASGMAGAQETPDGWVAIDPSGNTVILARG